tara:strand:+ start:65 stop:664 length:600 start_codon:yes stop_codon:yes gene_type:complete
MSKVAITGNASGAGVFTIASPNSATDRTLTLPDETGTVDTLSRAGNVLQVVSTTKTDTFSTTSTSYVDITGMSVTITPTSASSKILVLVNMVGGSGPTATALCTFRMVRGATAVGVGASAAGFTQASVGGIRSPDDANSSWAVNCSVLDAPATTSATTYKVQGFIESNTLRINTTGNDSASLNFSYRGASTITVMEISA